MQLWSGLGYYSRARNLHRCAQIVVGQHGGRFPGSADELAKLPGIGRSTAAAIAAFCFGEPAAILDGNVKRVFCRHFGIEGHPAERRVEQQLWTIAQRELPATALDTYTQGLMDLGAMLCTRRRPRCGDCPVRLSCFAHANDCQERLPTPRPAKASPLRERALLLIVRDGSVLLERRPPWGIWGGLLSLPEAEPGSPQSLASEAEARYGVKIAQAQGLAPIRHAFTHFRLLAHPVLLRLVDADSTSAMTFAEDAPTRWVPGHELADQALPKPVKTLLLGLSLR
jgi:A/G-specific adenine glycosylase